MHVELLESRVFLHGGDDDCFVSPLRGLTAEQLEEKVVSDFGKRRDANRKQFHDGVDFSDRRGEQQRDIVPVADGYIARIGFSSTFGQVVIVQHTGGGQTLYAHLKKGSVGIADGAEVKYPTALKKGKTQWVDLKPDQLPVSAGSSDIGIMGNTGRSEATHLHLEYAPDKIVLGAAKKKLDKHGRADPMPMVCDDDSLTGTWKGQYVGTTVVDVWKLKETRKKQTKKNPDEEIFKITGTGSIKYRGGEPTEYDITGTRRGNRVTLRLILNEGYVVEATWKDNELTGTRSETFQISPVVPLEVLGFTFIKA